MSKKRLLMVTTSFPYGHGESFVEAELAHVADRFETVTLAPCFFESGKPPRVVSHRVELAYATARWGAARIMHVAASFFSALSRYQWLGEAAHVLKNPHRAENIKELVRCLYRARMFEQFLEHQHALGHSFDMIYFYWIVPEIAGALAFRRKTELPHSIAVVSRAHGGDLYEERRLGGYAGLTTSIIGGLDAIYCISQHGKTYLDLKYPALADRFHVSRLGVDDPGFISPQPAGEVLSILSVSFMVPGKRLHRIIEAINCMLTTHPGLKVRWTHIGDGDLSDQLHALTRQVFIGKQVEVDFKGYMRQPDIVALYRHAGFDVIVNVSDTEGIPVSLMEASSVGIPMVATDVGGSGEIVNAFNGVLINENASAESIAEALIRFHDRENVMQYRARARAYWDDHFNAKSNYRQFGQALLRCMEQP
ncbi:MAG: glycosyltransferase [Massilia sp.]